MITSLHQKPWQQVTRQWKSMDKTKSMESWEYEWDFILGDSKNCSGAWCGRELGASKSREMMTVTFWPHCDCLNMVMEVFSMKSVNFTVIQLKEPGLMFYNLYGCFHIFLTILLLLTVNIFCIYGNVDMCSPIHAVPSLPVRWQGTTSVLLLCISFTLTTSTLTLLAPDVWRFSPSEQILCATSWVS